MIFIKMQNVLLDKQIQLEFAENSPSKVKK